MKKISPPASTKASIQYLNGLQTLATVALGRMAIISMILAISEALLISSLQKAAVLAVKRATVYGQAALT
jgi:hypothetical protein